MTFEQIPHQLHYLNNKYFINSKGWNIYNTEAVQIMEQLGNIMQYNIQKRQIAWHIEPTLIRLLLKGHSDLGLHCCLAYLSQEL